MELNKIYNEDCLIGLKEIEDGSIDLLLTDCPYKISSGGTPTDEKWLAQHPKGMLNNNGNKIVKDGKLFENNDILFAD